MLSKKYRISKDKEYKKIFRRSKKVDTENLSFRIAKSQLPSRNYKYNETTNNTEKKLLNNRSTDQQINRSTNSRFGFVVSNKVDKRAARRNGLKRRLRAVIGESLDNIKPGFDVVIMVKKQPKYPYQYEEIKGEVLEGLKKIDLISE